MLKAYEWVEAVVTFLIILMMMRNKKIRTRR
jgi:hypothetical protein